MDESLHEPEEAILRSWQINATPWSRAVREQRIASRKQVTNQAIVDAVSGLRPRRVLDVGCGEGWLARALTQTGVEVCGVDAIPALIDEARRTGGGRFEVCSYAALAAGSPLPGDFDAVVCNFSLLGKESVESLLGAIGRHLHTSGHLVVQTLHPLVACGSRPYRDGWRTGSWDGFSADFSDPAPWYFRTLAGWHAMLRHSGLDVVECREPTARDAEVPSSIIFICRRRVAATVGNGAMT